MDDLALGFLALLIGGLFCFRGYVTMRIVISLWGALVGFGLGAGAVSAITGDGFLAGTVAWLVGVVVAVAFSALAYLYYEVSIVVAMAGVGFALGATVMAALNVTSSWAVIVVGVVVGVALAAVAIVADLPMLLLTILTATGGASAVVAGAMLLVGEIETVDLDGANVIVRIQEAPGWWVLYVVLAGVGVASQLRALPAVRGTTREQWAKDGGGQLRAG